MEKLRENYRNLERFYAEDMNKMTHIINSLSDNAQVFISPTNNEKVVGEIDADIKVGDIVIDDGSVNQDQKGFIYKVEDVHEEELSEWFKNDFETIKPEDDVVVCVYHQNGNKYALLTSGVSKDEPASEVTVEDVEGTDAITDGVTEDTIINIRPSDSVENAFVFYRKKEGEETAWLATKNTANGVAFFSNPSAEGAQNKNIQIEYHPESAITCIFTICDDDKKRYFWTNGSIFKTKDGETPNSDVRKCDFNFFVKKSKIITVVTLSTLNDGSGGGGDGHRYDASKDALAEGINSGTIAYGNKSHAEGYLTGAYGDNSHAEGEESYFNQYDYATVSFYVNNISTYYIYGDFDYDEYRHGDRNPHKILGFRWNGVDYTFRTLELHTKVGSTTIGYDFEIDRIPGMDTTGSYSVDVYIGYGAYGEASHVEGYNCGAYGFYSHAEGELSEAVGNHSHAEGSECHAYGENSHAEGSGTMAIGYHSHAEGEQSYAYGGCSHAEGEYSYAYGEYSHVEGYYTESNNSSEHAEGSYNRSHQFTDSYGSSGNTQHSIGIGTSESDRKNAFEVMQNGDIYVYGLGGYDGTNAGRPGIKTLQQIILGT